MRRRSLRVLLLLGLVASTLYSASPAEANHNTGRFTCRASAIRGEFMGFAVEPFVANPQKDPCTNSMSALGFQQSFDVGDTTVAVNVSVAPVSTTTMPGEFAHADARLALVTIEGGGHEISAELIQAEADARCPGPSLTGSSHLAALTIDGETQELVSEPMTFELGGLGTLYLNRQEIVEFEDGRDLVQQAIFLDGTNGPDLVLSEAIAGYRGNPCDQPYFLVMDDESIDAGVEPNNFSAEDVNDNNSALGQRTELPYFDARPNLPLTLYSGQVGDEGWFGPKHIPDSWDAAGPGDDGLRNYMGHPSQPYPHGVGPGLGTGSNPEALLDKIPLVNPLRVDALKLLEGHRVCAVVYDSDVSMNYGPINGSLKGENLGVVAFEVISVTERTNGSSGSLPVVQIMILDADGDVSGGQGVCEEDLALFTEAPEPNSSSEPYDTVPD